MIKKKFKANNYLKMNILYSLLIITNIILFIGLIYHYASTGINIELSTFEYFSTVIPTIIILGIIVSALPQLRKGGSILYDSGYLIIITLLGLMTSYFSGKSNTATLFGPYLEMFRILCVILIFIITALQTRPFKEIAHGKFTKKNLSICFVLFLAFGLYATHFHLIVDNTPANVRCMVVMISGLFAGPYVGVPVGIISGAYRFTAGGVTALPCAVSTVLSGIIGSLIFIWNGKKFPKPLPAAALMFLFTGFEMFLIVMLTPPDISFPYIENIYPRMLFASVIGILIFSMFIKKEEEKESDSTNINEEINKLKDETEENDEIKELKNEIANLKSEIKNLKK